MRKKSKNKKSSTPPLKRNDLPSAIHVLFAFKNNGRQIAKRKKYQLLNQTKKETHDGFHHFNLSDRMNSYAFKFAIIQCMLCYYGATDDLTMYESFLEIQSWHILPFLLPSLKITRKSLIECNHQIHRLLKESTQLNTQLNKDNNINININKTIELLIFYIINRPIDPDNRYLFLKTEISIYNERLRMNLSYKQLISRWYSLRHKFINNFFDLNSSSAFTGSTFKLLNRFNSVFRLASTIISLREDNNESVKKAIQYCLKQDKTSSNCTAVAASLVFIYMLYSVCILPIWIFVMQLSLGITAGYFMLPITFEFTRALNQLNTLINNNQLEKELIKLLNNIQLPIAPAIIIVGISPIKTQTLSTPKPSIQPHLPQQTHRASSPPDPCTTTKKNSLDQPIKKVPPPRQPTITNQNTNPELQTMTPIVFESERNEHFTYYPGVEEEPATAHPVIHDDILRFYVAIREENKEPPAALIKLLMKGLTYAGPKGQEGLKRLNNGRSEIKFLGHDGDMRYLQADDEGQWVSGITDKRCLIFERMGSHKKVAQKLSSSKPRLSKTTR